MNKTKNPYQSPQITEVRLDNEISLVLVSNPPDGPEEGMNQQTPEYFNNNQAVLQG
jgi:hypothetical protein